ncbi:MAG: ATP phosphoribosyltransferase regulatory subunit, partial [Bacteroidetes bacterium]|nr:ATP phosphoribosyltransferase regulatory subunit [Bacteroidota bacterium]
MAQKPRIPKGTRDFNPEQVAKRNYIFNIIKSSFERFGFQPIETPSFELSETLLGKYGEEGDRLIFKVLDSGDFFEKSTRNRVGERQFTFLNFHLLDSLRFIFKKIVEDDSFEYEKLVNSSFVFQDSGYHIY